MRHPTRNPGRRLVPAPLTRWQSEEALLQRQRDVVLRVRLDIGVGVVKQRDVGSRQDHVSA